LAQAFSQCASAYILFRYYKTPELDFTTKSADNWAISSAKRRRSWIDARRRSSHFKQVDGHIFFASFSEYFHIRPQTPTCYLMKCAKLVLTPRAVYTREGRLDSAGSSSLKLFIHLYAPTQTNTSAKQDQAPLSAAFQYRSMVATLTTSVYLHQQFF